jgi:hypothetical protein
MTKSAMKLAASVFALVLGWAILAFGQTGGTGTVFVTSIGDVTFPFTPPTSAGTVVGTINNMAIGGTTRAAGAFTTLTSSGAYTPTGGVGPAAGFSISPRLVMTGNWKPLAITDGTEVTCVATTTYVAEVFVPSNMTVTGVALVNATAVAGNVQVGLADSTGAPITAALSASTAASGTAAYQRVPFATAYAAKGPATYYVQLQCNNTGYKFRAHTVGDFGTQSQTSGTYGTFASFTPAGTFTTAVGPVASFY